jgi:hypothetical protein
MAHTEKNRIIFIIHDNSTEVSAFKIESCCNSPLSTDDSIRNSTKET